MPSFRFSIFRLSFYPSFRLSVFTSCRNSGNLSIRDFVIFYFYNNLNLRSSWNTLVFVFMKRAVKSEIYKIGLIHQRKGPPIWNFKLQLFAQGTVIQYKEKEHQEVQIIWILTPKYRVIVVIYNLQIFSHLLHIFIG